MTPTGPGPAQIGDADFPPAAIPASELSHNPSNGALTLLSNVTAPVTNGAGIEQQPAVTGICAAADNNGSPPSAENLWTGSTGVNRHDNPEAMVTPQNAERHDPATAEHKHGSWKFIQRVVAWAGPDEPGYVNLHYLPPEDPTQPNKKGGMRGRAFRDRNEFMGFAQWCTANPQHVAHTYFCTSTQLHPGKAYNGKLTAARSAAAALSLKAIWLDIDVKPDQPDKAYTSLSAARDGLGAFVANAGLPTPSALVRSGSGLHCYWISSRPLAVAEWRPYAEGLKAEAVRCGLKCDAGLTTDCARVLRIPGTWNSKTSPPRPVELEHLGEDYDFATTLAGLAQIGAAAAAAVAAPKAIPVFDLSDPAKWSGPAAAFAPLDPTADKLSDGINAHDDRPLNPDQIIVKCPHFRDAATTRGAGYPQGLWMLDVLACTFFENGKKWAHALSRGYAAYDRAETVAMYDRKKADKQRGLGWPSCKAFENEGAKECATCPFRSKIKSPLNLAERAAEAQQPGQAGADQNNAGPQASASAPTAPSAPETVYYYPGNETVCRAALNRAVASDPCTFASGDMLVILRVPDQTKSEFERWGGDLPGTTPALPPDIIERAETLEWMTRSGGKGGLRWNRSKPPRDFCTDYITQMRGRYTARLLAGIARVPHMHDDGSIWTESGYDQETCIFVDRAPELTLPNFPTLDDARAALQRVLKPFEHYTFEDRDKGLLKIFAANLTALERPYMKTAPLFAVNGKQSGTGKGQICRAVGRLALGTVPPFMAWGHDDDEFTKRLDTMLLASPAMLVIDNCNNRLLRGDTLEMAISEGRATIRRFTKLEAVAVQNRSFFMADGNNLQISGDMSRRSIKTNILPRSASPERDTFPFTPENYVIEHRIALLNDYYTIMRAYRHAGMPRSGLPAAGSFPEWERKVRDLVWWLKKYDLTEEFDKNKRDDPEQQADAALLAALRDHFGEEWFKAAEIDTILKRATEARRFGWPQNTIAGPTGPTGSSGAAASSTGSTGGTGAPTANVVPTGPTGSAGSGSAILEAAEQRFGSKQDYAKACGIWARGVQDKFVDDYALRGRQDKHTKIFSFRVTLASPKSAR